MANVNVGLRLYSGATAELTGMDPDQAAALLAHYAKSDLDAPLRVTGLVQGGVELRVGDVDEIRVRRSY